MDDPRLDAIILELGRINTVLSRAQRKVLALLLHLSRTVKFVEVGDSKYADATRRIVVEIDGGRHVDVDFDGTLELLDDPPGLPWAFIGAYVTEVGKIPDDAGPITHRPA